MAMRSCLNDVGLGQYADLLEENGFETWPDILVITESDLEQMGVLLGHRRKLQRAIRLSTGSGEESCSSLPSTSTQQHQKRRYRRHPKRDQNAPTRSRSAYQLFADDIRQRTRDSGATFVELAKFVGLSWTNQTLDEREIWTSQAFEAKKRYQEQLQTYRGSEEYSQYHQYIQDFKNRHKPSSHSMRPSIDGSEAAVYDTPHPNNSSEAPNSIPSPSSPLTSEQLQRRSTVESNASDTWDERSGLEDAAHLLIDCASRNLEMLGDGSETQTELQKPAARGQSTTVSRGEESSFFRTVLES